MENEIFGREYDSSLEVPHWIGGRQDKGEPPKIHMEIEPILNNLQEGLKVHYNRLSGKGVKIGEFSYACFGYLKDELLKEMLQGGFGIFVDAWYLCAFLNTYYTSK